MTRYANDMKRLLDRRGALKARDGAIIDPVVDDVNGVQWYFKYRKNAPSKYKWLAMGQQVPLFATQLSTLTPTPINTNVQSTAVVTIPFSGEYRSSLDFQISAGGSTATLPIAVLLDGTSTLASFTDVVIASDAEYYSINDIIYREVLTQHTLNAAFQVSVLGPTITANSIAVAPRRISV